MCGISWCQATKTPGGSETFRVSAEIAGIAGNIVLNNALDTVRSEYISRLLKGVIQTKKAILIAINMPEAPKTKCKTCFGDPRIILYGFKKDPPPYIPTFLTP